MKVRNLNFRYGCVEALHFGNAVEHGGGHLLVHAIKEEIPGNAHAYSIQVRSRRKSEVPAGDHVHCQGAIFGARSEWTDMIETEGQRQNAMAAHPAIGGLESCDAA